VLAQITDAGRRAVELATLDLVKNQFALSALDEPALTALFALLRPVREHAGDF
jgi:hypothetical protein